MADGFFRSKNGYTVIQNVITRDRTISLKAKGLYLQIQAYITIPDKKWMKSEFMEMVPEGKKAFESAWKELKNTGYLKVHMTSKGTTWTVEYELLDEPQLGNHTFYYNSKGELVRADGIKNPDGVSQDGASQIGASPMGVSPIGVPQKGVPGNGVSGNGISRSGVSRNGESNNKSLTINTDNNNCIINPSINPSENENEGQNDTQAPVILNLSRKICQGDIEDVKIQLEQEDGIDYTVAFDRKRMTMILMFLAKWNDNIIWDDMSEMHRDAYRLVIKSLIEMATSRGVMNLGEAHVTYRHVIDAINGIIANGKENTFDDFLYITVDRVVDALNERTIKSPEAYCKTIIWNCLSTAGLEWNSMIYKGVHGKL